MFRPPLPREACYTIVIKSYHKRVETLATSLVSYLTLPQVWDVVIVFGLADAGGGSSETPEILNGLWCWSGRPVKVIAMPRKDDGLPSRFVEPVARGMIETDAVLDLDDDVVAHPLTFAAVFRAWWWNREQLVSLRSQLRVGGTRAESDTMTHFQYATWTVAQRSGLLQVAELALTQFAMSSRGIHEAVVDKISVRHGIADVFRWNGEGMLTGCVLDVNVGLLRAGGITGMLTFFVSCLFTSRIRYYVQFCRGD